MEHIIGIDLGTTNSLCAIFEDGQPKLIPNVHGKFLTPSVVGMLDNGEIVVGEPAKQLRVTRPKNCAWCFKRMMGTNRKFELADRTWDSTELSSMVLKSLKEDAEKYLDCEVEDAVITVPAYFNDHQRTATKVAGQLIGLNVRRIINEPTAAALVYGFHDRQAEKDLIVIDLGGGTFDVTVMEVFEGTLEIVSTAGETQLGGEDFTARIASWVLSQRQMQLETAELKFPLMVSRLYEQCESAKRMLAMMQESVIRLPNENGEVNDSSDSITLNRGLLKEIVDPIVKRLARPINRALRDASRSVKDISDVILVGGSTRSLDVREFVSDLFNTSPHSDINPDEVVAMGAAVQGALILDDAAVDDMVMTDVCPFTLGISVAKEFGKKRFSGYFSPIINRNSTIPCSHEEYFETIYPNQQSVMVEVYQGESRKVEDNLFLGSLEVSGFPPGPSGQPFCVRFTYDLNGILEVEAFMPNSEERFKTVLTNEDCHLSEMEIEQALSKMQCLKFYPRDDAANKNLMLFAERVVGEVSPHQRDDLEMALDVFEHSMESREPEIFESAKQTLLIALSALGFPYNQESGEL